MSTAHKIMRNQAPASSYIVSAKIDRGGYTVTKSTHARNKEHAQKTLERWETNGDIISASVKNN